MHLQGCDVLVLGGYARHGDYHTLIAGVARVTRNGQLLLILLADFNVPPDELEEDGSLSQLHASVIRPEGSKTCHQQGGSFIDYGQSLSH